MALIILAYYGVLLHCVEDIWYIKNWASPLIHGIGQYLSAELDQWVEWPKQVVTGF